MKNGLEIDFYGTKRWYKKGKFHREDGPAIEDTNGTKEWYQEDKLHREDGPAIELSNETKFWYYKDKEIYCSSTEEFMKLIKLKVFW